RVCDGPLTGLRKSGKRAVPGTEGRGIRTHGRRSRHLFSRGGRRHPWRSRSTRRPPSRTSAPPRAPAVRFPALQREIHPLAGGEVVLLHGPLLTLFPVPHIVSTAFAVRPAANSV